MRIPNTFGFDVKAAVYAEYHSVEELEKWIAEGRITSPFLHIGCGSNGAALAHRRHGSDRGR